MVILFMSGRCMLLIGVVIMVDWSMVVMNGLPPVVFILGVVRVVICEVRGAQDGVFVEVLGLNIVLVVECVV